MKISSIAIVLILSHAGLVFGQKMTLEEARRAIPKQEIPAFWQTDLEKLAAQCANLKQGKAEVIAKSPGGRPILLVAFGAAEIGETKANFNSAIGGRDVSAYMDKAARTKPVVFLLGPVHGQETEGLVGLVNLIQIMETGRDLRDREHSELRELAKRCRLLIIPTGNPDGLARFEPRTSRGMTIVETEFWGMGTWSDDAVAMWPHSKRLHPMAGPRVGFRGCYFNDKGVNPMHDEFFAPMSTEAPAILGVARREGPDLAVSLHTNASAPEILRPAYMPMEVQEEALAVASRYYALLEQSKLPHRQLFKPAPESGKIPAPFNLTSALYHTSGATAFTFEGPRGLIDEKACHSDFDQMLDMHLRLFEAMMRHGVEKKQGARKP